MLQIANHGLRVSCFTLAQKIFWDRLIKLFEQISVGYWALAGRQYSMCSTH